MSTLLEQCMYWYEIHDALNRMFLFAPDEPDQKRVVVTPYRLTFYLGERSTKMDYAHQPHEATLGLCLARLAIEAIRREGDKAIVSIPHHGEVILEGHTQVWEFFEGQLKGHLEGNCPHVHNCQD